ncbi:oxidoreductase [Longimycelium tulufanense]|uniref:Oxidoreductase n=1 Tax=Longimycelium tulufanense TaxID=907463 RepID=A0A8J3CG71_9PSEU|nr:NAD(P)/FAD-dependent oxidoreductase [Longimycelium tulufanense]GGM62397.1 oxidoreductase [Longimycelium tulufanense]
MDRRTPVIDLLVAGAGPVGLATAIRAAWAGLRVVVVDPRPSPIDKACAEALLPPAVAALGELGIDVMGRPLAGIRHLDRQHQAAVDFRARPGLGVRRTMLQHAMRSRADQLGVTLLPRRVGTVHQDASGVKAAGVRARYLVAADGLHSPIRHRLGLYRPTRGPARYGLRRHFVVPPWTDHLEVHWSAEGEAYVTPVADELVNVAVLGTVPRRFADALPAFPLLAERLAGARPVSAERGDGPLCQLTRARVSGRVMLVGDAAGSVDALTGDGLSLGMVTALALVDCVVTEHPQEYERAWRRLSRRHRLVTRSLLAAARRPWLRRRLVPLAARHPDLVQTLLRHLR